MKREEVLSIRQISKRTGMSPPTVVKNIKDPRCQRYKVEIEGYKHFRWREGVIPVLKKIKYENQIKQRRRLGEMRRKIGKENREKLKRKLPSWAEE